MIQSNGSKLTEYQKYKAYFFVALACLVIVYSLNFILQHDQIVLINWEDGFYESLTALSFFLCAMIFLFFLVRTKKIIHLFFVLLFIFGAGEEISWGERIIGFEVPEKLAEINTQQEFNVHNLKVLSSFNENGIKPGIQRWMTITAMYLLFCLGYAILLPAAFMKIPFVRKIVEKIHVPVPPLIIGIFFLINYILFKSIGQIDVIDPRADELHSIIDESFEFCSSVIFLLISLSFLQDFLKAKKIS